MSDQEDKIFAGLVTPPLPSDPERTPTLPPEDSIDLLFKLANRMERKIDDVTTICERVDNRSLDQLEAQKRTDAAYASLESRVTLVEMTRVVLPTLVPTAIALTALATAMVSIVVSLAR